MICVNDGEWNSVQFKYITSLSLPSSPSEMVCANKSYEELRTGMCLASILMLIAVLKSSRTMGVWNYLLVDKCSLLFLSQRKVLVSFHSIVIFIIFGWLPLKKDLSI